MRTVSFRDCNCMATEKKNYITPPRIIFKIVLNIEIHLCLFYFFCCLPCFDSKTPVTLWDSILPMSTVWGPKRWWRGKPLPCRWLKPYLHKTDLDIMLRLVHLETSWNQWSYDSDIDWQYHDVSQLTISCEYYYVAKSHTSRNHQLHQHYHDDSRFLATKTATKMIWWNMSNSARRHLEHHQYHFNRSSHQTLIFSGPAKQARTSKHQTTTTHTHTNKKNTHQTTETQNHTPTTNRLGPFKPSLFSLELAIWLADEKIMWMPWWLNQGDGLQSHLCEVGSKWRVLKPYPKWRKMNPYPPEV